MTLCPVGQTGFDKILANSNILRKSSSCPYLPLSDKAEHYMKGTNTLAYKSGIQVTTKKSFKHCHQAQGERTLRLQRNQKEGNDYVEA